MSGTRHPSAKYQLGPQRAHSPRAQGSHECKQTTLFPDAVRNRLSPVLGSPLFSTMLGPVKHQYRTVPLSLYLAWCCCSSFPTTLVAEFCQTLRQSSMPSQLRGPLIQWSSDITDAQSCLRSMHSSFTQQALRGPCPPRGGISLEEFLAGPVTLACPQQAVFRVLIDLCLGRVRS
jgi:hypothetical protein